MFEQLPCNFVRNRRHRVFTPTVTTSTISTPTSLRREHLRRRTYVPTTVNANGLYTESFYAERHLRQKINNVVWGKQGKIPLKKFPLIPKTITLDSQNFFLFLVALVELLRSATIDPVFSRRSYILGVTSFHFPTLPIQKKVAKKKKLSTGSNPTQWCKNFAFFS